MGTMFLPFKMENLHTSEQIERLRQKDPAIFRELLDVYGDTLTRAIIQIVGSSELAKDVLQETFLKVWKNSERYDTTKGQLFTWLVNIARNTAIDYTRASYYRRYRNLESIAESNYSRENQFLHLDYLDMLTHVAGLEQKQRTLVELFYFEGYTLEEISEKIDVPLGTVKTRLHYALKKLRLIYSRDIIED